MPSRAVVVVIDDSDSEREATSPRRTSQTRYAVAAPTTPPRRATQATAPTTGTNRGNNAWVVFTGRVPGIYRTWDAAAAQLHGCPNVYRAYRTLQEAELAWAARHMPHTAALSSAPSVASPTIRAPYPPPAAASAASCRHTAAASPLSAPAPYPTPAAASCRHAASAPSAAASPLSAPVPCPTPAAASRRRENSEGPAAPMPQPRQHETASMLRATPSARKPARRLDAEAHQTPCATPIRPPSPFGPFGLPSLGGEGGALDADDGAYYAVLQGASPGVYFGSARANKAMGHRGTRQVVQAATRHEAWSILDAWMAVQDARGAMAPP